jgi:hypothetical protein
MLLGDAGLETKVETRVRPDFGHNLSNAERICLTLRPTFVVGGVTPQKSGSFGVRPSCP